MFQKFLHHPSYINFPSVPRVFTVFIPTALFEFAAETLSGVVEILRRIWGLMNKTWPLCGFLTNFGGLSKVPLQDTQSASNPNSLEFLESFFVKTFLLSVSESE